MSDIDRFMAKVKVQANGCWEWTGKIHNSGYVTFFSNGKAMLAHRWSYQYYKGLLHPSMFVCHSCDNRICVNPDHLWLGDASDNMKDMVSKNRHKNQTGSQNNFSKLSETAVKDIKARGYFGGAPKGGNIKELAEEYNVSYDTVRSIVKGVSWTHV